jgi:cold shock CspA family protein
MAWPLQIDFHGVDHSDALEVRLRKEVDRLGRFFDRVTACRVAVEKPHQRHHQGNLFAIRVMITLPDGRSVTVTRSPDPAHQHVDPYVTVRDAFKAASRRLQDEARRLRRHVKVHEAALSEGRIASLLAEKNGGFIRTGDGREVYFHRNSVAGRGFARLKIGDRVRFHAEDGEQGPQAAVVKPA